MKCPHCHHSFLVNWKRYLKGFFLRYVCPSCAQTSKLRIAKKYFITSLLPPIVFFAVWSSIATLVFHSRVAFLTGAALTVLFGAVWDKYCMNRSGILDFVTPSVSKTVE